MSGLFISKSLIQWQLIPLFQDVAQDDEDDFNAAQEVGDALSQILNSCKVIWCVRGLRSTFITFCF